MVNVTIYGIHGSYGILLVDGVHGVMDWKPGDHPKDFHVHNGAMNGGRLSKLLFYFVQIGYAVFVFHVWPLQG